MGSAVPFRVDLFDDEIDSIRTFDPDSQRSLYPVPEVRLLPGREFPMDEAARARFRNRWRGNSLFGYRAGNRNRCTLRRKRLRRRCVLGCVCGCDTRDQSGGCGRGGCGW
jgi:transcription-repair coupling factor (superfamily II helicase)